MKKQKRHSFMVLFLLAATIVFASCDEDSSGDTNLLKGAAALAHRIASIPADAERLRSMSVDELAAESELPIIIITTEGGAPITSKEDYVHGTFEMTNADAYNIALQNMTDDGIRLRGNTTAGLPKKPYRLKFNKKISFFGRTANKSWVLLADFLDMSQIKNYTALTLAARMDGMDFAPLARHVNLFLNGEFQGLYLVSDQVDEKEGRTDVEEDVENWPEGEAPFLVEMDYYAPQEGTEGIDYFTIFIHSMGISRPHAIKYPEPEDCGDPEDDGYAECVQENEDRFNYIETYVHDADTEIRAHGDYESYVDRDSIIDYYLLEELMGTAEIDFNSIYMSKAVNGLLKMGPVWDFDLSAGGFTSGFKDNDHEWSYTIWYSQTNWFAALLDDPEFVDALYTRWTALSGTIDNHIDEISAYKDYIKEDAERDHVLWMRYRYTLNKLLTFEGQYEYVLDYLANRKQWMTDEITDLYNTYH